MTEADRETIAGYLQVVDETSQSEQTRQQQLASYVQAALHTDGAHHKQWYLHQIAEALGIATGGADPGIAP
jgi:hypothetical protein